MKKIVILIISIIALCVIAGGVLILTGVIHLPWKQEAETKPEPVLCVEYMNSFMLVDESGVVTGNSSEKPEGIPVVNGISFSEIVVGEQLKPAEEAEYAYARKVIETLKKNDLSADEVYISSELEATVYMGEIRILLGPDKQTDEKLRDLRDFYEDTEGLSGTLDMQEVSHNNLGYSLKPDKEQKKESDNNES